VFGAKRQPSKESDAEVSYPPRDDARKRRFFRQLNTLPHAALII
jgi:hypothetical protein